MVLSSGWERAEAEAAAFKLQRDAAIQQKLATEDRVQHLDGALKEVMKQLRSGREEQEQRIHEITVKKTQECDNLRAEMESKLAEASHILAQTRSELMESRAENMALSNALQVYTRIVRSPLLELSSSLQCWHLHCSRLISVVSFFRLTLSFDGFDSGAFKSFSRRQ